MRRSHRIPDRSEITDETALLLDVAAQIAFPDGTVSGLTLRRAARRGELQAERIGGRIYTTLANIKLWRERCRQTVKRSPPQQLDDSAEGQAAYESAKRVARQIRESEKAARAERKLQPR